MGHKPQVHIKCSVDLEYINYQNIEYYKQYEFMTGERLVFLTSGISSEEIINLGSASINEDIEDIARDVCDRINTFIQNGLIEHRRIPQPSFTFDEKKEEALSWAKEIVSIYSYSKEAFTEILSKEFSSKVVAYAIDNCGADWNKQAIEQAKFYVSNMSYSYIDLIEVLEVAEKFTREQAIFAANNCGTDWNRQAVWEADGILFVETLSKQELIKKLEDRGFSHEQAVYGAQNNHILN